MDKKKKRKSSNKSSKRKKVTKNPVYKKWWFWLSILIIIIVLVAGSKPENISTFIIEFLEMIFSIFLICGVISSWYFIKKKPDITKRNYSIVVTLVAVFMIGFVIPRIDNRPLSSINTKEAVADSEGQFKIKGTRKNKSVKITSDDAYIEMDKDEKNFVATATLKKDLNSIVLLSSDDNEEKRDIIKVDNTKYVEAIEKQEKLELEKQKKEEEKQAIENQKKIDKEKQKQENSDITKLSKEPTDEQKEILLTLTDMQFKEQYPYKGSKIHSILGVLQDWTENDGKWYYKVEATIVNAFGAEQKVNLEVHITPNSADSGYVEFLAY